MTLLVFLLSQPIEVAGRLQPSAVACCSAVCHWLRNCAIFNCFRSDGRVFFSAGRLGGSILEFAIAAQMVFEDVELG